MNPPIPEQSLASIKEAIFGGHKIQAIKLHRQATGSDLAEAKLQVEKLEADLRVASPEKFTGPTPGKGCLSIMVMVCVLVCAVVIWMFR